MAQSNSLGGGCFLLFATPFALAGLGASGVLAWGTYQELRMSRWSETPCTILKAELETNSNGDDTTYKVNARYSYRFAGQDYTSERVRILDFFLETAGKPRTIHATLEEHRVQGRPFRCFVNPARPSEAILYRQLPWGEPAFLGMFALSFGGFGLGVWTAFLWSCFGGDPTRLRTGDPARPWTVRADWAQGRLCCSRRNTALGRSIAAAFATLVGLPAVIASSRAVAAGDGTAYLGLLYGVLAAVLWLWAAGALRQWRAYGESVFEMAGTPGVVGGVLAGVIRVPARLKVEEQPLTLTLRCTRCVASGGDSHTNETVWQSEQTVVRLLAEADFERSAVAVLFNVPYDVPTSAPEAQEPVTWTLELRSAGSRPPYRAEFEAPLFVTGESQSNAQPDASPVAEYAVTSEGEDPCVAAGVEREPLPDGYRYHFRPRRAPALFLSLGVFQIVLVAACVALVHFRAELPLPLVIIVPAFLALFAVLLTIAIIDAALFRSTVDVSRAGLEVHYGWLGHDRERFIEADAVCIITTAFAASLNANRYFNLVAQTTAKKSVVLGKYVRDHALAERLARQMLAVLRGDGLGRSP